MPQSQNAGTYGTRRHIPRSRAGQQASATSVPELSLISVSRGGTTCPAISHGTMRNLGERRGRPPCDWRCALAGPGSEPESGRVDTTCRALLSQTSRPRRRLPAPSDADTCLRLPRCVPFTAALHRPHPLCAATACTAPPHAPIQRCAPLSAAPTRAYHTPRDQNRAASSASGSGT